jgi:hypothetical protein
MAAARKLAPPPIKYGGRRRKPPLSVVPATEPIEVQKRVALDRMADVYLDCRDIGHQWQRAGSKFVEKKRQIEQIFVCRCTTRRVRRLALDGTIISSFYEYPEGYVLPLGSGLMTASDRAHVRLRMTGL